MQRHANTAQLLRALRLLHGDEYQPDRQECGNDGDPKHRLEMIGCQPHQADGEERAEEGPNRIKRLTQAEARATQMRRTDIGDERIAWRTTDALADTVDEARCDQPSDGGRERKDRLCE